MNAMKGMELHEGAHHTRLDCHFNWGELCRRMYIMSTSQQR
ncbi:hypothetical protein ES703_02963 [subsurface metagenome]